MFTMSVLFGEGTFLDTFKSAKYSLFIKMNAQCKEVTIVPPPYCQGSQNL